MNKLKILIICMLFVTAISAQKDSHVIELLPTELNFKFGFEISELIDRRLIKSNVGFAQKGMANRRVKAILPDTFPSYMLEVFDDILPECSNCPQIVVIIHEFNVSEMTKGMSEIGLFRVQMEFAKRESDKLYSLGFVEKQFEGKGMDVTMGHAKRVLAGLKYCLYEFKNQDWENIDGEIIDFDEELTFDYSIIPTVGLYSSFSKMCKNQPFLTEEYKIVETKEKYPKFYIKDKKGKPLKNRVMGFSDGEHIYINASRYSYQSHFVRSKQIGRYLYFEDRFADPMAGVMFGLVGSALSNNPRAVILDTTTGLVILLDSIKMENFLDDHPNIKGEYMTSRKKIQDKYAAIEKVNEKFK